MKVSLGIILGIFILLVLFFVGPVLALYDVVVNERTLSPFVLAGMSTTFRAVHTVYIIECHFVLLILTIGVLAMIVSLKSIKEAKEKGYVALKGSLIAQVMLSLLYLLPFCWFLFAVPGYWAWVNWSLSQSG